MTSWQSDAIQEIECKAEGFYYMTHPISSDAGQMIFIDDDFEQKIRRIKQEIEEHDSKLVREK